MESDDGSRGQGFRWDDPRRRGMSAVDRLWAAGGIIFGLGFVGYLFIVGLSITHMDAPESTQGLPPGPVVVAVFFATIGALLIGGALLAFALVASTVSLARRIVSFLRRL